MGSIILLKNTKEQVEFVIYVDQRRPQRVPRAAMATTKLPTRQLGKGGPLVSKLGFGAMRLSGMSSLFGFI